VNDRQRGGLLSPRLPPATIIEGQRIMASSSNHKTPPPAPTARPRERIDERNTSNDSDKTLPGGKDPRDPQYPGPMSTSENVTTEEQKAAQTARKEADITDKDVPYGSTATRAEQVEAQKAAAENPLSPQSTTINEPHGGNAAGLVAPPRPEGQRNIVPTGHPSGWKFDPQTGERLANQESRGRARLEDDDEEETEVELASPVMLTDDTGGTHRYEAGKQKMPRSHAEHWYLKQHLVPAKKGAKKSDDK
jgi:hypothetical protein